MKVFISQAMKDRTDDEIKSEREQIRKELNSKSENLSIEIIDSFIEDDIGNNTPLELLGESLKFLSQADCAYFADGWQSARGCRVEHLCCELYNIPIQRD